jgi:membrane associated rhomboid family serine protease
VCWNLGPGVGLWLVLLAGTGGNALTAIAHRADHVSVGASTATFGAIGILAALRITGRTGSGRRKWWVVMAAGLALLALLGTGPHADILAHLFGFLVGGGLGLMAALVLRRPVPALVQWLLVVAFAAVLVVAWRVAF